MTDLDMANENHLRAINGQPMREDNHIYGEEVMPEITATYLQDGYPKSKGLDGWYRDLTVREAKLLSGYETIYAIDRQGRVREVLVNGKPHTWVRSPGCVLSLKYGLREFFRVGIKSQQSYESIEGRGTRIVVPVKQPFDPNTPPEIVLDWVKEHELG